MFRTMGWPYDLYHVFTICQVLVHRAMAAMTVAGPSCESWDRVPWGVESWGKHHVDILRRAMILGFSWNFHGILLGCWANMVQFCQLLIWRCTWGLEVPMDPFLWWPWWWNFPVLILQAVDGRAVESWGQCWHWLRDHHAAHANAGNPGTSLGE